MGFFDKLFGKKEKETLNEGLQKTKESFFGKIAKAIVGKSTIDDEVLDNLEEALIGADVGVDTTLAIIEKIQDKVKQQKYSNTTELNSLLQNAIKEILVDVGNDDFKNFKIVLPTFFIGYVDCVNDKPKEYKNNSLFLLTL